jgi:hypothetical protein
MRDAGHTEDAGRAGAAEYPSVSADEAGVSPEVFFLIGALYAELPAAQPAFDTFHTVRATHVPRYERIRPDEGRSG